MRLATLFFSNFFVVAHSKCLANMSEMSTNIDINVLVNDNTIYRAYQKETAQTFIDAYNAWDIDAILGYRAPDCIHQPLPSSMKKPGKNNDEYRKYLEKIMPLFANFTVTVHRQIHDFEARSCVLHASSTAETGIGTYTNEYALFLTFTESGKQVERIEEFVDSAYSEKFFSELKIPS